MIKFCPYLRSPSEDEDLCIIKCLLHRGWVLSLIKGACKSLNNCVFDAFPTRTRVNLDETLQLCHRCDHTCVRLMNWILSLPYSVKVDILNLVVAPLGTDSGTETPVRGVLQCGEAVSEETHETRLSSFQYLHVLESTVDHRNAWVRDRESVRRVPTTQTGNTTERWLQYHANIVRFHRIGWFPGCKWRREHVPLHSETGKEKTWAVVVHWPVTNVRGEPRLLAKVSFDALRLTHGTDEDKCCTKMVGCFFLGTITWTWGRIGHAMCVGLKRRTRQVWNLGLRYIWLLLANILMFLFVSFSSLFRIPVHYNGNGTTPNLTRWYLWMCSNRTQVQCRIVELKLHDCCHRRLLFNHILIMSMFKTIPRTVPKSFIWKGSS